MSKTTKSTLNRALDINQNPQIYGAFAEIGAGQEVARFFFQAGQASATIAKTMSAYDMVYSDEIYGKEPNGRYVCESRLNKMLDKEYGLLIRRLDATRGKTSTFFAYANTVTTGGQTKRVCHGWMGVRFQTKPGGEYNDIIMHVRMLDKYRLQQQETLGVLGVNLVYTGFFAHAKADSFIENLTENIKQGQVVIDVIKTSGPDLAHLNNHLLNLELVRKGLAESVLFSSKKEIQFISDAIYNKPLIIQRGSFKPITNTQIDILNKGQEQFKKDFKSESKQAKVILELTMQNLSSKGQMQEQDFLDRVSSLCDLGYDVLVSNYFLFYKLKNSLRQYTQSPIVFLISAAHLEKVFDEKYYEDLEGGILEGLGKLLDTKTNLYIYPHKTEKLCTTAAVYRPDGDMQNIYSYFMSKKFIVDVSGCDQIEEFIHSDDIQKLIKKGDKAWEKMVPTIIKDQIKKDKLFRFL